MEKIIETKLVYLSCRRLYIIMTTNVIQNHKIFKIHCKKNYNSILICSFYMIIFRFSVIEFAQIKDIIIILFHRHILLITAYSVDNKIY